MSRESNEKVWDERDPFIEEGQASLQSQSQTRSRRWTAILLHIGLVWLYTIAALIAIKINTSAPTTSLFPIDDLSIEYQARPYDDYIISPYAGKPSPELDKKWHDLLEKTTIRVSANELRRSNQTSVPLPEGGYMAWLGVYHELHCIKMLRQWNYREHYHPDVTTDEEAVHWIIHADHCLDVLRSAAMCHADTTLTTFGWADQPKPMLNTRQIDHKCVNWEFLQDSVKARIVSEEEMDAMVNPRDL